MKIDLTGRTAVIVGGSGGLGEAMAHTLSDAGAAHDNRRPARQIDFQGSDPSCLNPWPGLTRPSSNSYDRTEPDFP